MIIPPELFRANDIRGIAQRDLGDEVVETIGRGLGTCLAGQGRVVIGGDVRLSTSRIRAALARGLLTTGIEILDLGVIATPILSYALWHLEDHLAGGVMVTASHNPQEYNGLKISRGREILFGEELTALSRLIAGGQFCCGPGRLEKRAVVADYLRFLSSKITLQRGLKVVVDAGHGCASTTAPRFLRSLGCEVIELYCQEDGRFPAHSPDPTQPEALTQLRQTVVREKAELGLAFDGDADRLVVVDETGEILWGDRYMILFYREILPRYPGMRAVIEVKCSQCLVEEVQRLGGVPLFYKSGHALVRAKMKEEGAVFAGEMSGHLFFADEHDGYDDALYAAGRLLRILSATPASLSQLLADLPRYSATPELRAPCAEKHKFSVSQRLVEHFQTRYPCITVDGVRFQNGPSWGLIRASNVGPQLIIRTEGPSARERDRGLQIILEILEKQPEVDVTPLRQWLQQGSSIS